jgi:hypothetical protein
MFNLYEVDASQEFALCRGFVLKTPWLTPVHPHESIYID